MAQYKCFSCNNKINSEELDRRFICPKCGSRIFFKPRNKPKTVKTD